MDLPADTSRPARDAQLGAYRRLSGAARVALAFEMSESAVAITRAGLRARHPDWTAEALEDGLREILLGTDLAQRARASGER